MKRNELKGKQTQGTARVTPNGHTVSVKNIGGRMVVAEATEVFMHNIQRRANAALFAETINVANEHKMWPLDWVERVKELEDAIRVIHTAFDKHETAMNEWAGSNLPFRDLRDGVFSDKSVEAMNYTLGDMQGAIHDARALLTTKP